MKLREIRKNIALELSMCGIEANAFETDILLQTALEINRTQLLTTLDTLVTDEQLKRISALCEKRKSGYPLQYLVGRWDFYGLEFFVGEGVLIPRADTETLIDVAKELFKSSQNPTVIDLCSGSGCIAVTLEKELSAKVFALEKSEKAYSYLEKNIKHNNSTVIPMLCDVLENETIKKLPKADLIVSNPPYIKTSVIQTLSKEVSFEPRMALDGEEDGLKFYREITHNWKETLKNGGYLLYEIGFDQAQEVSKILSESGFCDITAVCDLAKNPRVVYARKQ